MLREKDDNERICNFIYEIATKMREMEIAYTEVTPELDNRKLGHIEGKIDAYLEIAKRLQEVFL